MRLDQINFEIRLGNKKMGLPDLATPFLHLQLFVLKIKEYSLFVQRFSTTPSIVPRRSG
jgi:hypothetical protein